MRAGLQIHIECCAARLRSGLLNGEDLGVLEAVIGMGSGTNDCTRIIDDYSADARIG